MALLLHNVNNNLCLKVFKHKFSSSFLSQSSTLFCASNLVKSYVFWPKLNQLSPVNSVILDRHFHRNNKKFQSDKLYHNVNEPFAVPVPKPESWIQIDDVYQSLISHQEIKQRQHNLIRLTNEWLKKSSSSKGKLKSSPLILIASSPPQYQANTNIPVNECKQSSDFIYFTGLHSGSSDQITGDCVLALFLEDGENIDSMRSIIFSPNRTKSERLWHGPELPLQFKNWLNQICDDVQPLSELVAFLNKHLQTNRRDLFFSRKGLQYRPEVVTQLRCFLKHSLRIGENYDREEEEDERDLEKWSKNLNQSIRSVNVRDCSSLIDQLRWIKSDSEAKALKRVGKIGARSLKDTIDWSRQMYKHQSFTFLESHIAAKFAFETKCMGARRLSFPSVCAAGTRATIIHYGRNDHLISAGQEDDSWILTDVGCEDVDGYCCDISRTWPINPTGEDGDKFQLRLQLYQALIGVQHELVNSIEVGKTTLNDLNQQMLDLLAKVLITFDVFANSVSKTDIQNVVRKICPHHVSHYIGLDVHDTPSISRSLPLMSGVCFTIEPGLYFPADIGSSLPIKPEFANIGLRVEDDFLIEPETGTLINLTNDCPKLSL